MEKDALITKFLKTKEHRKEIIKDPALIEQAKALGETIREKHSFNKDFKGMINERLLRSQDEDFVIFEDQLKKNYFNGTISLEEVKDQMRHALQAKRLLKK